MSQPRRDVVMALATLPLWRALVVPRTGVQVVATFGVIADMLADVGGDQIDLKVIVGAEGDCELANRRPPTSPPCRGACRVPRRPQR